MPGAGATSVVRCRAGRQRVRCHLRVDGVGDVGCEAVRVVDRLIEVGAVEHGRRVERPGGVRSAGQLARLVALVGNRQHVGRLRIVERSQAGLGIGRHRLDDLLEGAARREGRVARAVDARELEGVGGRAGDSELTVQQLDHAADVGGIDALAVREAVRVERDHGRVRLRDRSRRAAARRDLATVGVIAGIEVAHLDHIGLRDREDEGHQAHALGAVLHFPDHLEARALAEAALLQHRPVRAGLQRALVVGDVDARMELRVELAAREVCLDRIDRHQ